MHTALAQALDLAAPTRPRRVLWHGPRGAGKTWWLAAAEQAAAQRGFTVARVAGRAADRDLAFAGLASLFQPFPQVIDALGDDGAAFHHEVARALQGDARRGDAGRVEQGGLSKVPDLPRLAGELADELQLRMRDLGERCCRALVVAAADESGELGPIGAALRQLGEPGTDTIEPAEEAGIVEVIGSRVAFADPWMRHAAYHLLACGRSLSY